MMKNEKGITLVALTITVIILFILAGIGLNGSYDVLEKAKDDKFIGELGIINHAITQQYSMAEAVNQTKMSPSGPEVLFWIGERIDDVSKKIDLPDKSTLINVSAEINDFYAKADEFEFDYQEDFYYRLGPSDLIKIGIQKSQDTYIVNYKTGEVYNETMKQTAASKLLYLSSTIND